MAKEAHNLIEMGRLGNALISLHLLERSELSSDLEKALHVKEGQHRTRADSCQSADAKPLHDEPHTHFELYQRWDQRIKLVSFDLDNTLASTDHLEKMRTSGDEDGVRKSLPALVPFEGIEDVLNQISESPLHLALVTRSPGWYAKMVLNHLFPKVKWDALVCYDDVENPKPYPEALERLIKQFNLVPKQLVHIGDDEEDVGMAYRAGAHPLLCTWYEKTNQNYSKAKALCPDFVFKAPTQILSYLEAPVLHLPMLESFLTEEDWEGQEYMDAETYEVRFGRDTAQILILGRYFSNEGTTLHLHKHHRLSQQIYRKFDSSQPFPIPHTWTAALSFFIARLHVEQAIDMVSVIPAKADQDPRLERLIESGVDWQDNSVEIVPDLLRFDAEAKSIKRLDKGGRFAGVYDHLLVNKPCEGKTVLLFDDVLTTGATLVAAKKRLEEAGAKRVVCAALAKSISRYQLKDLSPRYCPVCSDETDKIILTLLKNKQKSTKFWGCTNYFDKQIKCKYTEKFE